MKNRYRKHQQHLTNPADTKKKWHQHVWVKSMGILSAMSLLIGILSQLPIVKDMFLTDREKHLKNTFLQGELRMPELVTESLKIDPELLTPNTSAGPRIRGILIPGLHKMRKLYLSAGAVKSIDIKQLYNSNRANLDSAIRFGSYISTDHPIYVYAIDDRLFIDAKFVQLDNECIGWIEANHWSLYKSKKIYYRDDDKNLEVYDSDHQIMFSAHYDDNSKFLTIAGYFNGIDEVFVLSNNPTYNTPWLTYKKNQPQWLEKARRKIATIKSTF